MGQKVLRSEDHSCLYHNIGKAYEAKNTSLLIPSSNLATISRLTKTKKQVKVIDFLVQELEKYTDFIFGIPGATIEDLAPALRGRRLKSVVTRHEQGAAHMADGYARVSGKLGVCFGIGPGVLNMAHPLTAAQADGTPLLAIVGIVPQKFFGKGASQEISPQRSDITSAFKNLIKFSDMPVNALNAQLVINNAIKSAISDPKGVSLLCLSTDIMKSNIEYVNTPRIERPLLLDKTNLEKAANALRRAKAPLIYAGSGIISAQATPALIRIAEMLNCPVVTSPRAKGAFPESHPLALGVFGLGGSPAADKYILEFEQDVVLGVGYGFNDAGTNAFCPEIKPSKTFIQIDTNFNNISRNYHADIPIVGDANLALEALIEILQKGPVYKSDLEIVEKIKNMPYPETKEFSGSGWLYDFNPRDVIIEIQKHLPDDTIYFIDIGSFMTNAIHSLRIDKPGTFFLPLGLGGMGFSIPAAVGGKLAAFDRTVVAIVGDGGAAMTGIEIAVAVEYQIPIKIFVLNNQSFAFLTQMRKYFKVEERAEMGIPTRHNNRIDFVKFAESLGAKGIKIDKTRGITSEIIDEIMSSKIPVVVDVAVDPEAFPPIEKRLESVKKNF